MSFHVHCDHPGCASTAALTFDQIDHECGPARWVSIRATRTPERVGAFMWQESADACCADHANEVVKRFVGVYPTIHLRGGQA